MPSAPSWNPLSNILSSSSLYDFRCTLSAPILFPNRLSLAGGKPHACRRLFLFGTADERLGRVPRVVDLGWYESSGRAGQRDRAADHLTKLALRWFRAVSTIMTSPPRRALQTRICLRAQRRQWRDQGNAHLFSDRLQGLVAAKSWQNRVANALRPPLLADSSFSG
jgi:hypothetical protein